MFPASRAAWVPVFIATPTSAWASAGASFVPSPVIATRLPPACSRRISAILSSGVASARKSSTPASSAIACAVSGLSPVIITVRMPIARSSSKRSRMPFLDDVLEVDDAERAAVLGDDERRAAAARDAVDERRQLAASVAASLADPAPDRVRGALADRAAVEVDAAHPRLGGERDERRAARARARAARSAPSRARRSSGPRASRRRGWRAGPRRRARASVTPGSGRNSAACRLPSVIVPVLSSSSVEQSPAASTARPESASTLRRTSRSMPAIPIAESSAPIVVGIRQTSRATSTIVSCAVAGVDRERLQRHDRDQEDDRQPGEEDVERDLVRRLLPRRALDERDHAVEEALAGPLRHPHDDLVGEHARAAGHGRAVAARLADHRRRLAGDRRLVDARDALDHLAVGGDQLARGDDDDVAARAAGSRAPPRPTRPARRRRAIVSARVLRSVSACALPRPSATASAKFANSTVNQSQIAISQAKTLGSDDRERGDERRCRARR